MHGRNVFEPMAARKVFGAFLLIEMRTVIRGKLHPGDSILIRGPYEGNASVMQRLQIRAMCDLKRGLGKTKRGGSCQAKQEYNRFSCVHDWGIIPKVSVLVQTHKRTGIKCVI